MKLSIIVPVYQVEAYIYTCLDSLRCNNSSDVEIIVVDDGSTDNSYAEIKRFEESCKQQNLIYIKQANAGLSQARNTGLQVAKGDYVFFVDGDDWLATDALERVITALHALTPDMLVFDVWKSYTHFNLPMQGAHMQPGKRYTYADVLELTFAGKMMVSAWSKVFKRSLLTNPPFEFPLGVWYEDLQLIKLYLEHPDAEVCYLPERLYYYRQREGSITQTFTDKLFDKYTACENINRWLAEYNKLQAYAKLFQNFYLRAMIIEMVNSLATSANDKTYIRSTVQRILSKPMSISMKQNYMQNKTLHTKHKCALFFILHLSSLYMFVFKMRFTFRQWRFSQ